MKKLITIGLIILFVMLLLFFVLGCKKDAIDPEKKLPDNITVVHMEEVDIPGVWNPFKIIGSYYSVVDQAYRYYVISNNGVYIDCGSRSLDMSFANDDKHYERRNYTWTGGRMYSAIKLDPFKKIYKLVKTDSLGVSLRDTLDWTQLPTPK